MKKGALKVVSSVFIIAGFAGFIFYLGFVSLKVPAGKFGVMVSSTSGVYPKIIENGSFCWRWENLIPRNAKIYVFNKENTTISKSIKKALPSADIYSSLLQGNPDFTYEFSYDINFDLNPENLLQLVKDGNAEGQEKLDEYLDKTGDQICLDLSEYLVKNSSGEIVFRYDSQSLIENSGIRNKYTGLTVTRVEVKKAMIPDMELYSLAKNSLQKYQAVVDEKLVEAARNHAERFAAEERAVKKLEKIAEVLKQNPELNTLLSNGNAADVLKALNDLH